MTSMPSRTAASNAATISGLFAEQQPPSGASGHVEDAVVPDVRARRDALEIVHRGVAAAVVLDAEPGRPASTSVFTPAMTPATYVPWNELSRSSGALFAPGPAKPRATITFGVVEPVVPFGNPGDTRTRSGRGTVLVVDAVVDDGDLDALALCARQPGELRRAEHRRPAVQRACTSSSDRPLRRSARRGVPAASRTARSRRSRSRAPGSGARRPPRASPAQARDRLRCAASSLARYERENELRDVQLAATAEPGSPRAYVAAASGGSSSVTITRTRCRVRELPNRTSGAGRTFGTSAARRRRAASGRRSRRPSR